MRKTKQLMKQFVKRQRQFPPFSAYEAKINYNKKVM